MQMHPTKRGKPERLGLFFYRNSDKNSDTPNLNTRFIVNPDG